MKKNKGITLIALIITIIVMLILVAVSVNVLIKSNLIGTAEKAVDKYKTASEEEANGDTIEINGKKYDSIEDYIKLSSINIPGGTRVTEPTEYKDGDKTAIIPAGYTLSGIDSERTIDGGLVIYDIPVVDLENAGEDFWTKTTTVGTEIYPTVQCNYNQFVWVPVENPFVTKAELDKIIADSNESITTEQEAMQTLVDSGIYPMAVELANETDYRGILYDFSAETNKVKITVMNFSTTDDYNDYQRIKYNREPGKLTSSSQPTNYTDDTKERELNLQAEYNNIVKSVKEQKGFWVARYELSYNTKGESKRGKPVAIASDSVTYKWYGLYDACKTIYEAQNKNEVQSNMMYGSQWDQIMIWMKDVKNTHDSSKYYILDSSYMGNYNFTSPDNQIIPQVSGYKNEYSVKQVFDLGGNLVEYTTEAEDTWRRVARGGPNGNMGIIMGSYFKNSYPPDFTNKYSARFALYVSL